MREIPRLAPENREKEKAHLFLVACPYVFDPEGKKVTYLFAINSGCPPEALGHRNWGVVELVEAAYTKIVRGAVGAAKEDLQSRVSDREWRIVVGNKEGPLFRERLPEEGIDETRLVSVIRRIPSSVLLIQESLLTTFTTACSMAGVTYRLHHHTEPLCADCVKFGCEGPESCVQRRPDEKERIEKGSKFRLSQE